MQLFKALEEQKLANGLLSASSGLPAKTTDIIQFSCSEMVSLGPMPTRFGGTYLLHLGKTQTQQCSAVSWWAWHSSSFSRTKTQKRSWTQPSIDR